MRGPAMMFRLSKLADYGIVLLTHVADAPEGENSTARGLAEKSGLPLPTVSKILKRFSRAGVLAAQRGKNGGYTLAKPAPEITVAAMITAVDGPIALTDCSSHVPSVCNLSITCPVRGNWARITGTVHKALSGLTLADMTPPRPCVETLSHSYRAASRSASALDSSMDSSGALRATLKVIES